jgi:hypothetical protein
MIDYSIHLLTTTKLIREIYEDCQNNKNMEAMEKCLLAASEMKMAYNAINHMVSTNDPDQIIGDWKHELPTMPR